MICKTFICDRCGAHIVSEDAPSAWRMIHAQIPDQAIDLDAAKTLLCGTCYETFTTRSITGLVNMINELSNTDLYNVKEHIKQIEYNRMPKVTLHGRTV